MLSVLLVCPAHSNLHNRGVVQQELIKGNKGFTGIKNPKSPIQKAKGTSSSSKAGDSIGVPLHWAYSERRQPICNPAKNQSRCHAKGPFSLLELEEKLEISLNSNSHKKKNRYVMYGICMTALRLRA